MLDPAVVKDRNAFQICSSVFEGLVKYDPSSLKIQPVIARKWHSQDNVVWTFFLRDDVFFHDGSKCNAAAVKFNFDRQLNPSHPYNKPSYGKFSSMQSFFGVYGESILKVEAPQPDKIRIVLAKPDATFLNKMAHVSAFIVSPLAVKSYGNLFAEKPVGTGPYRFVEWRKPGRIILAANSDYSRPAPPYLDRLVFETYFDFESCVRQLSRGNIDIAAELSMKQIKWGASGSEIVCKSFNTSDLCLLLMNCRSKDLKNAKFRKAVGYLINRKELSLLFDGETADSFLYRTAYSKQPQLRYSPEAAEAIIRNIPDLQAKTFTLIYPSEPVSHMMEPEEVAMKMRDCLRKGGIRIVMKKMSAGDFERALSLGTYDFAVYMNVDFSGNTDMSVSSMWTAKALKHGRNLSFYTNSSIEELLAKSRAAKKDSQRLAMYRRIDQILIGDMPAVPVFYTNQSFAYLRNVRGFRVYPSGVLDMTGVWISK